MNMGCRSRTNGVSSASDELHGFRWQAPQRKLEVQTVFELDFDRRLGRRLREGP